MAETKKENQTTVLAEENQTSVAKENQTGINAKKGQASIPENQTNMAFRYDKRNWALLEIIWFKNHFETISIHGLLFGSRKNMANKLFSM